MTVRKPLVLDSGRIEELQSGDSISSGDHLVLASPVDTTPSDLLAKVTAGLNIGITNPGLTNDFLIVNNNGVRTLSSGTDITVDNTDPHNPVVNFTGTIPTGVDPYAVALTGVDTSGGHSSSWIPKVGQQSSSRDIIRGITNGAYSASTGIYTAQVAGDYRIVFFADMTRSVPSTNAYASIVINSGSIPTPITAEFMPVVDPASATTQCQVYIEAYVTLALGDTVFISVTPQGGSTDTILGDFLMIYRPNGIGQQGPAGTNGAVTSLTTTGSSGASTLNSGVLNIPIYSGGSNCKYASTMEPAAASANISIDTGASNNWVAIASMLIPYGDVELTTSSEMALIVPQPVNGASYILAIYSVGSGSPYNLVASSGIQTMPSSSSWIYALLTNIVSSLLNAGEKYFPVFFWNGNGALAQGINGQNMNVSPYLAWYKSNMGTLTSAPSTITPDGERSYHLFMRVKS